MSSSFTELRGRILNDVKRRGIAEVGNSVLSCDAALRLCLDHHLECTLYYSSGIFQFTCGLPLLPGSLTVKVPGIPPYEYKG
jgi:hypothetical protein